MLASNGKWQLSFSKKINKWTLAKFLERKSPRIAACLVKRNDLHENGYIMVQKTKNFDNDELVTHRFADV